MKIGVDARLLERKMTGIGRYLDGLVSHIPECDAKNEYFLFTYNSLKRSGGKNIHIIPTLYFSPRGVVQKLISPIWMNFILPLYLRREKIDLFFSPNHALPFLKGKRKNAAVILDLFNVINKKFHSFLYRWYVKFTLPHSVRNSDVIITISEASKKDIVNFFKIPEKMVKIIYLAAEKKFEPRDLSAEEKQKLQEKYNLPEKFILYVGVIEERKNIEGILKIADLLIKKNNTPIVLVGRVGHGGKKYLEKIKSRKNVFYRGFVEDKDLPLLYNLSSAFLFPSFYEGFGLPPLEAMQSGIPVVASNASSLAEVIGDGGIMLPPDDYAGFADALKKIIEDHNFRSAVARKGLAQAGKFNFKKTACETVGVFDTLK